MPSIVAPLTAAHLQQSSFLVGGFPSTLLVPSPFTAQVPSAADINPHLWSLTWAMAREFPPQKWPRYFNSENVFPGGIWTATFLPLQNRTLLKPLAGQKNSGPVVLSWELHRVPAVYRKQCHEIFRLRGDIRIGNWLPGDEYTGESIRIP